VSAFVMIKTFEEVYD